MSKLTLSDTFDRELEEAMWSSNSRPSKKKKKTEEVTPDEEERLLGDTWWECVGEIDIFFDALSRPPTPSCGEATEEQIEKISATSPSCREAKEEESERILPPHPLVGRLKKKKSRSRPPHPLVGRLKRMWT